MTLRGYDDLYAPRFLLAPLTTGSDLLDDIAADIAAFTFEDKARGMDKCTMVVNNPDLKYSNDPRFRAGLTFRLAWGYANEISPVRFMIVKGAKPTFPVGMPTIELTAFDMGRLMAVGSRAHNYGAVSSADVARSIATHFGFNSNIEDSGDARRQHRVQPANVTPYEYLGRLADRLGFDFYIDGTTLNFHRPDTGQPPSHVFTYFRDGQSVLKSFTPEVKAARPQAVHRANTNPSGTAGAAGAAGAARTSRPQAAYGLNVAFADQRLSQATTPAAAATAAVTTPTPETAAHVHRAHAIAVQTRIEMRAHQASIELIGQPRLRARNIIRVDVGDAKYDGLWRVQETTHAIDSAGGYVTVARLNRSGLNRRTAPHQAPVTGPRNTTSETVEVRRRRIAYETHRVTEEATRITRPVSPAPPAGVPLP